VLYNPDCFLPQDRCNHEGISASQGRHNLKERRVELPTQTFIPLFSLYIAQFKPRFRNNIISPVALYIDINWEGHVAGMGQMNNTFKFLVVSAEAKWNTQT
jgi:hypothetical protein